MRVRDDINYRNKVKAEGITRGVCWLKSLPPEEPRWVGARTPSISSHGFSSSVLHLPSAPILAFKSADILPFAFGVFDWALFWWEFCSALPIEWTRRDELQPISPCA